MPSFFATPQQRAEAIHAFQRGEIERLADPDCAREMSRRDHYARLGEWPGAARGRKVLELGCGPGRFAALLAALGCEVVAADPLSFETWPLILRHHHVTFLAGVHAERLPFEDGSFDAVACLGALLYFDDPVVAFREIRRVLRPRGDLVVRTVNRRNLYTRVHRRAIDPASKQLYTMEELVHLLESHGFAAGTRFSYAANSPIWPGYWWYLINGVISLELQQRLSDAIPAAARTHHAVFAQRVD